MQQNYSPYVRPSLQQSQINLYLPSLKPLLFALPRADAEVLKKAFGGFGCDKDTIFRLLCHRSKTQIEKIKSEYFELYKEDLIQRFVSELRDPEEYLALCLLHARSDADAFILRRATKGIGTDESILIYILCSRSSEQMVKIKESYIKEYKKPLADHISSDTSGRFKTILLSLIDTQKSTSRGDHVSGALQATSLYSRTFGDDKTMDELIKVFSESSFEQIKLIDQGYKNQFGKSLTSELQQFKGDYGACLLAILSFAHNPIHYHAQFLNKAICESRIYDVIVVIATRAEIDLATILYSYNELFDSRAEDDISKTFKDKYPSVVKSIHMLMGL